MKKNNLNYVFVAIVIITIVNIWAALSLNKSGPEENQKILKEILALQKDRSMDNYLNQNLNTGTEINYIDDDNLNVDLSGKKFLIEEIKNIFKTELKSVIAELKDNSDFIMSDSNNDSSGPSIPEHVRKVSFDKSQDIVNNAIDSGRWTVTDGEELRDQLSNLSKTEKIIIYKRLLPYVNRGEIKVDKNLFF